MDFFLQDPEEQRLPPEGVRLRNLNITPHPHGDKVKIDLQLSPFKQRPNIELSIFDASGKAVAKSNILETMLNKLEFVMHIRKPILGGEYRLSALVYYQNLPAQAQTEVDVPILEPMVVDHQETTFFLPRPDR